MPKKSGLLLLVLLRYLGDLDMRFFGLFWGGGFIAEVKKRQKATPYGVHIILRVGKWEKRLDSPRASLLDPWLPCGWGYK